MSDSLLSFVAQDGTNLLQMATLPQQFSIKAYLPRIVRLVAVSVVLLTLVGVGLLGYLWNQRDQVVVLPKPTGSFAVGRVGFDWVDPTRLETLGPNKSDHRELMVWTWYPAVPSTTAKLADYLPDNWRQAVENDWGVASSFFRQNLATVHVHALANVPLAASSKPFPVLIMQPGLGPIATDYTTLAEDLASHGYIVAASTPTYSSNVVVFQDGRIAPQSAKGTVADALTPDQAKPVLDNLVTIWAADNRFIMDQLQSLNASDPIGRFTGHIDLNAIGVWGHSFGGASAAQTCRLDGRCKAGADLDGTLYGDVVQVGLHQPFMFIWSETPQQPDESWQQTMRDAEAVYNRLNSGGYQVTIQGAQHFNFSDYAVTYEPVVKLLGQLGNIDGQRGLRITDDYLIAFFDKYLQGIDSTLLKGPAADYPEVQFQSR